MDISQIVMPQIETSHLAATETWFAGAPTISEALPPGLPTSRLSAFPRLAEEDSLNLGLPSPRGTPAGARRKALKAGKGVAAKGDAGCDAGGDAGGVSTRLTAAILGCRRDSEADAADAHEQMRYEEMVRRLTVTLVRVRVS